MIRLDLKLGSPSHRLVNNGSMLRSSNSYNGCRKKVLDICMHESFKQRCHLTFTEESFVLTFTEESFVLTFTEELFVLTCTE